MARESQHPSFKLLESDVEYFSQIPPVFLKALKLLHYEKMNYAEIAQQLGWPAGTVKSRINRARAIIRAAREADEPEEMMQEPTYGRWAGVGLGGG
jgi:hypothetical protein